MLARTVHGRVRAAHASAAASSAAGEAAPPAQRVDGVGHLDHAGLVGRAVEADVADHLAADQRGPGHPVGGGGVGEHLVVRIRHSQASSRRYGVSGAPARADARSRSPSSSAAMATSGARTSTTSALTRVAPVTRAGLPNVVGVSSGGTGPSGHTTAHTLPTTADSGTVPPPGRSWW